MQNIQFSVLMSTYYNDNPIHLKEALDSIFHQTYPPSEVVLVEDGILTKKLYEVLDIYIERYKGIFKRVKINKNSGLGNALNIGLNNCSFELVARMDSDDICVRDRFEKQYNFLINNPNVAVLGTIVEEFNKKIGDLSILRKSPCDYLKILKYSKFRNPFNHPTVMFRKNMILKADSYESVPFFEDYYLWIKLLNNGVLIQNLNEPLLYFRIGNDLISRRSGFRYLKNEFNFLLKIYKIGFINFHELVINIILKSPIRLCPNFFILFIYKNVLRIRSR